jgi:hypothetical protein
MCARGTRVALHGHCGVQIAGTCGLTGACSWRARSSRVELQLCPRGGPMAAHALYRRLSRRPQLKRGR